MFSNYRGSLRGWLLAAALGAWAGESEAVAQGTLLINGGFDSSGDGLAGWTFNQATASSVFYDANGAPTKDVKNAIEVVPGSPGNGRLLRAAPTSTSSGFVGFAEQVVTLPAGSTGKYIYFGGYLGGFDNDTDRVRIVVQMLKANGAPVGTLHATDYVVANQRNFEHVLLPRWGYGLIVQECAKIAIRIEIDHHDYWGLGALADELFAEVVDAPPAPIAHANDEELLNNTSFELGYDAARTSPLTLKRGGWEGNGSTKCWCDTYAAAATSGVSGQSGVDIAIKVEGLSRLLRHSGGNYPNASIQQVVDLRGDAEALGGFDNRRLRVSAYLGGASVVDGTGMRNANSEARIEVEFLDENLAGIAGAELVKLGPVSAQQRGWDMGLLFRSSDVDIPNGTAYVRFSVRMTLDSYVYDDELTAFVDKVSARLVEKSPHPPVKFNQNLIRNPSFDSNGSIGNSAITMGDPLGWEGAPDQTYNNRIVTSDYGSGANFAPIEFSANNSLGQRTATIGSYSNLAPTYLPYWDNLAYLRQRINVRGESENIKQGKLRYQISAWLGGVTLEGNSASVILKFVNDSNAELPGSYELKLAAGLYPLPSGPLYVKSGSIKIPKHTAEIWVEPKLVKMGYSPEPRPVIDKISLVITCDGDCTAPTPIFCDSDKVIAMSACKLDMSVVHANYVKKSPEKQDPIAYDKDQKEVLKELKKALKEATQSAQADGDFCTYTGTADQLNSSTQVMSAGLLSGITSGMNPNVKADRILRSELLVLLGVMQKKALNAEAKNIIKSDPQLGGKRVKYTVDFTTKAGAAIAKALTDGVTYTGALPTDLADLANQEVDAIVGQLHQ